MGTGKRRILRTKKVTKAKAKSPKKPELTERQIKAKEALERKGPKRHQLSKVLWYEWGEGLRVLRNNDYKNPNHFSLIEMREALTVLKLKSIQRAAASVA